MEARISTKNRLKLRYMGEDAAEIRKGEVYEAEPIEDSTAMYAVVDRSGTMYAYPKSLFEVVQEE